MGDITSANKVNESLKGGEKMETVHWKFSNRFRSQWVKVKFYNEKPDFLPEGNSPLAKKKGKRLTNVRFCEATKEAIVYPVLLDKESIGCPGAQYAFGWNSVLNDKDELLDTCLDKRDADEDILKSMLSTVPHFKEPFKYIGLNTEGEPDLVMSYIMPEDAMNLIKLYHNSHGKNLDISLCSMMSVCGGIAVRTYLEERMSFSFGCDDSRKYAQIGRNQLVVGIPKKLFKIFVS